VALVYLKFHGQSVLFGWMSPLQKGRAVEITGVLAGCEVRAGAGYPKAMTSKYLVMVKSFLGTSSCYNSILKRSPILRVYLNPGRDESATGMTLLNIYYALPLNSTFTDFLNEPDYFQNLGLPRACYQPPAADLVYQPTPLRATRPLLATA